MRMVLARSGWLLAACLVLPAFAFAEPATLIRGAGNANRLDLVVLGDGYTVSEQAKFADDAYGFLTAMFGQEPYKEYLPYFNVYRVDVISAESGASHPERGALKTTAFGAAYNCRAIQRLICVNIASVNTVLARSVPPQLRDLAIVIVNDSEYGGAGGGVAVVSTNPGAVEIILHELGHSLGLLGDEYVGGGGVCDTREWPYPNVTTQTGRSAIKWSYWIDAATPVPTSSTAAAVPGLYTGASYCDSGQYRPTYDSKMRTNGRPFDQINTEQLIKRFYNFVLPIDSVEPAGSSVIIGLADVQTFRITSPQPVSRALSVVWTLDGSTVGTGAAIRLAGTTVPAGTHTLQATVQDSTVAIRRDVASVSRAVHTWTIQSGLLPPTGFTASSSGSTVTLAWNAPAGGLLPTVYVLEAGSATGLADLASFSTGISLTSFSTTGVYPGIYYLRVRSSNGVVTSAPSNEARLIVGNGCSSPPSPPSGLTLGASSGGTFSLVWGAASGNPTTYLVEAGTASGLSNLVNSDLGSTTPSLTATGIGPGTYYVRVRGKNACGVGAPSNEIVVIVP